MEFHNHKNNSIVMVLVPAYLYGRETRTNDNGLRTISGRWKKTIYANRDNPNTNILLTLHHKLNNKLLDKTRD